MLSVTITEKDGPSTTTTFDKTEVLIGRVKGNDVVLPKTNVSKRHSRIVVKDGKIILIDLKSTNGTFVNGRKITGPQVMQDGDKIYIGDFTIEVKEIPGGMAGQPMPGPAPMGPVGLNPGMSHSNIPGLPASATLPPMNPMPGHPGGMPEMQSAPGMPGPGMPGPGMPGPGMPGPAGLSNPGFPQANLPGAPKIGGSAPSMDPINTLSGAPAIIPNNTMNPPMGPGAMPEPMQHPVSAPLPGAPSLGASPSIAGLPQVGGVGLNSNLPGARPAPSLSPSPSQPKQPSVISNAAPDPILEKKAPLASSSNVQGLSPAKSILNVNKNAIKPANRQDVGTASLPDPIVVDNARNAESDALINAARIVMDNYLSKNDFQAIVAQPYPPEADMQDACYNQLSACVNECRGSIGNVNIDTLLDMLLKEACGLGPIDSLIDDPDVTDFIIYNFETIVAERKGRREISSLQFTSGDTLFLVAQRLLAFQGVNPQTAPAVTEIRFGDGTQLQVILPPISVASTNIIVRKSTHTFRAMRDLVQSGCLSNVMSNFLALAIKARRNILIVGPQGSGRTAVLNALGAEIPDGERIITVENTAMLAMPQLHVMSFEAQSATYGQGGDLAALIRQTGKLRAEHVLADALQSPADASAFLSAICAGAQGSMATMTAINGSDGFNLLKNMISGDSANTGLIGNIDLVITVRAFTNAKRRIIDISEVVQEDGTFKLVPVYYWENTSMGHGATGNGNFKATGNVPLFCRELEHGGMNLDSNLFNA
jgi:pilus assembly protein CpaF